MNHPATVLQKRRSLQSQLFPRGIPKLWCPLVTHFRKAREADPSRTLAHFETLLPFVGGVLVPGSTGEGWQMSDEDIHRQLDLILPIAEASKVHVLIGILKTNLEAMLASIESVTKFLGHPAVVGITVCPPKGSGLSQSDIGVSLRRVLELDHPTALYQLPQVTENEMAPETVASLAKEFANFILFKDTSGFDRVAKSTVDLSGVFMVRGSEQGGYAAWPRAAGGCYDGFLLSTANVAAAKLARILDAAEARNDVTAQELSRELQAVIERAFALATECSLGNPFSNANKAIDHYLAHGIQANDYPSPMLISGDRLPADIMERFESLLQAHGWIPEQGYLDSSK